jgi:hypothetical protein
VLITSTSSMLWYECSWHALPCTLARNSETVSSNASGKVAERVLRNDINVKQIGRTCCCWAACVCAGSVQGLSCHMWHCSDVTRQCSSNAQLFTWISLSLPKLSFQDTHCHSEYAAPRVTQRNPSSTQHQITFTADQYTVSSAKEPYSKKQGIITSV